MGPIPAWLYLSSLIGCAGSSSADDADGDGFASLADGGTDCDDTSPEISPAATEVCSDDVDNDCDGQVDDDGIGSVVWYADLDGDRFGIDGVTENGCPDRPLSQGWALIPGDCDDTRFNINPAVDDDDCDGIDDDCDGVPDDQGAAIHWYTDADGDGYGDPDAVQIACASPIGTVADSGDCDDGAVGIHPAATDDTCDGVDDDCSGTLDQDAVPLWWYTDADGDGFGNPNTAVSICPPPDGAVSDATDCDDTDAAVGDVCAPLVTDQDGNVHATLAIAVATVPDGGEVYLAPGAYVLSAPLRITRDVSVVGVGSDRVSLFVSDPVGPLFDVEEAALTLRGVTLVGPAQGIVLYDGALDISEVVFDGTTALDSGGGINALLLTSGIFDDVRFVDTTAGYDGGGLSAVLATTPMSLTDVSFVNTVAGLVAPGVGGGMNVSFGGFDCTRCTFEGTHAESGGGIFSYVGTLTVVDSVFENTTANSAGAAISAALTTDLVVLRSRFCGGESAEGSAIDVDLADGYAGRLASSTFAEQSPLATGAVVSIDGGDWEVVNNTFAGSASSALVVDGPVGSVIDVVNNAFVDIAGTAVDSVAPAGSTLVDYSAFYDNGVDTVGTTNSANNLFGRDFALAAWTHDGDCANDTLTPTFGSPLVDAGEPSLSDPDGSRADIGATGGGDADPALHEDLDADGDPAFLDCDDGQSDQVSGGVEVCDGRDNDCDGQIDEDLPVTVFVRDLDGDGFGGEVEISSCEIEPPDGYAVSAGDCDDTDALVGPDAAEICNRIDDDCDGAVDLDDDDITDAVEVWNDFDGDGYGACDDPACTAQKVCNDQVAVHHATVGGDCNDSSPRVNPGATEIDSNLLDEDCDGVLGAEPPPPGPADAHTSACSHTASGSLGGVVFLMALGLRRRVRQR